MVSAIGYADPMSTDDDTAPITYREALNVVGTIMEATQIVVARLTRAAHIASADPADNQSVDQFAPNAFRAAATLRAAAAFVESLYGSKHETPSILRRAADQIDPPTVPAEPDLTTPEGWIAEATEARLVTSEMHAPNCDAERVALHDAWLEADEDSQIEACLARHFMLCVKL